MTDEKIEERLKMHIANIALAAISRTPGNLKEAKEALLREVARIAYDASNGH